MWRAACTAALMLWPFAGQALELALPGNAVLSREVIREADSYHLPVAPFADGSVPALEVEGRVVQQAWRLPAQSITTLQMLRPLRVQLQEAGYEIVLDCSGGECGGFDFRFGTYVLPAPDVFIDLLDYRFLSARQTGGVGAEDAPAASYISLMASRAGATGYIQIIRVSPPEAPVFRAEPSGMAPVPAGSIAEALLAQGHVILDDLSFESGSADLGPGPFASLEALAGLLRADAVLRVALVGHTDTVGGLDANIALSKRRATSVVDRLVDAHGVPRAQLDAEGMGYLAPVGPNLHHAGREANRRVEAVLLNSE